MAEMKVLVTDKVLRKKECELIIKTFKSKLKKSGTVGNSKNTKTTHRTSSSCAFTKENKKINKIGIKIIDFFSNSIKLPPPNQEPMQILRYKYGEEYKGHYDEFIIPDNKNSKKKIQWAKATGGRRLYSLILYLNDVTEGGETQYPHLKYKGSFLKVKPKRGRAIVHQNITKNGDCIREAYHLSTPVISNEKWVVVCWIRETKWKDINYDTF